MSIVYRYRSPTDYTKDEIKNNYIYFSKPIHYNDPYDGILNLYIEGTYEELSRYLYDYSLNSNLTEFAIKNNLQNKRITFDILRESNFSPLYLASLTRNPENILMWSHYAMNHTGICIGYKINANKLTVNKGYMEKYDIPLVDVIYKKDPPEFQNLIGLDFANELKRRVNTKFKDWEYEEETRLTLTRNFLDPKCDFHKLPYVYLPDDTVSEIIFGAKIDSKYKRDIIKIANEMDYSIKFRQAKINSFEYKLTIENINVECL